MIERKPCTTAEMKLLKAGALIADRRPSGDELAFTHAVLCQVGLPRSEVEGREFMRQSGDAWVNIGVIEVKSTLDDRTLAKAVAKIGEFDSLLDQGATESGYRPFRHIFAFELDRATDFGGWRAPCLALSRYAGARCQPDGIFVLDDHFSVLVREHGVGHVFGLHRGQTPAEVLQSSWDIQNEEIRRDIELDDSYCLDYFTTAAVDGLLLLAFLTFVIQRASAYQPTNVDYADLFCRWGGPALGGLMNFRSDDSDHVPVEF